MSVAASWSPPPTTCAAKAGVLRHAPGAQAYPTTDGKWVVAAGVILGVGGGLFEAWSNACRYVELGQ